jgi:hypothetical protein
MTGSPGHRFSRKEGDPFHVPDKFNELIRFAFAAVAAPMLVVGLSMGPLTSEDGLIMAGFAVVALLCLLDGIAMRRRRLQRIEEVAALRETLFRDETP